MNILITGGSGLLGIEVVKQLKQNHNVISIVRDKTIQPIDNVEFFECDLSSDFDIKLLPQKMDVIIHLAQSPFYKDFPTKADHVFDVNCRSTHKLLEYGRATGVKHFIFSSTGSVYEPYSGQMCENDLTSPISFYANTKIISEKLIQSYAAYFRISILRLFFLYGNHPNSKQTLINRLAHRILDGDDVSIEGANGSLIMTPTLTNDIAQCIDAIIHHELSGTLNLANPEQCSIKYIIDTLIEKLNKDVVINQLPEKPITSILPNLDAMQKQLPNINWTPFHEGVKLFQPDTV